MGNAFALILQNAAGEQEEMKTLQAVNTAVASYGLQLNASGLLQLVQERRRALQQTGRVEYAGGIGGSLINAFCDSPFISEEEYADILCALQELFYHIKDDTADKVSDEELMAFLKQKFNGVCRGEIDLLQREARTLIRRIKGYEEENSGIEEEEDD
ncbi:MAG: DUF6323 family protein [Oscillospiraceae bacterium]